MKDCSAALARPWLELPFLDTRGGAEGRKEHWHLSPWAATDVQPRMAPVTTDQLLPKHRRRHSTEVASGTARWFGKGYLGLIRNCRSIDAPGTGQPLFTFAAAAVRNAVVGAIGRLFRASSKCLIKVRISNGLVRKQTAPAFKACVRMLSSRTDVMKMIGTWHPWICSCLWSSTPLIPGILTSRIRQELSAYLGRSQEFVGRREGVSNVS